MTDEEITKEERKKAEKILRGLTWIGDKEEIIKSIVKNRIRKRKMNDEELKKQLEEATKKMRIIKEKLKIISMELNKIIKEIKR